MTDMASALWLSDYGEGRGLFVTCLARLHVCVQEVPLAAVREDDFNLIA